MTFSTLVALINVYSLLFSCITFEPSDALKIKLIHPYSPDSPAYLGNLTMPEKIKRLVTQSRKHSQVLKNRALPSRLSNQTLQLGHSKLLQPPVSGDNLGGYSGYVYAAEIGIGTFDGKPSYKTYHLSIDTGASNIWLQCEECQQPGNTCFLQVDPLFPNSQSHTYSPLTDDSDMCLPAQRNPADHLCYYDNAYEDGARAYGQVANESFTFVSSDPDNPSVSMYLVFGCGFNQTEFTGNPGEPEKTAGILGLNREQQALHVQLDPENIGLSFSYCFQDLLNYGYQHPTYLRFSEDIPRDPNTYQETPFQLLAGSYFYSIKLVDIMVGDISVAMPSLETLIMDTGSSITYLVESVYQLLIDTLKVWFARHINYQNKLPEFDPTEEPTFCVFKKPDQGYEIVPTIYLLLEGGVLEIKPQQGFVQLTDETGEDLFCLMIEPHDTLSILGAFQQVNHRFIYDTQQNKLLFRSEECALNP